MVSPRCSIGGLASNSFRRFSGLSKPMPEARASPCTCTLPSALPVMETSPEVLLSSRRMGPFTLSVRSKLPLTDGPMAQPAAAKAAAKSKPARAAEVRCLIVPPLNRDRRCEFTDIAVGLAGLKEDTQIERIMFRSGCALKSQEFFG